MPEVPAETFSNPFAPPDQERVDSRKSNLSNDDFRRLLMTPKVPAASSVAPVAASAAPKERRVSVEKVDDDKKQKKKSLYSKLKKEEDERQAEWAKKYRDRAKERRDDKNPDYNAVEEALPSTSTYRAVAPAGLVDPSIIAERRKRAIVESKFLGGDIQHTHLVKGLDYVLLDKVRGEMQTKQKEAEDRNILEQKREKERARAEVADDLKFHSTMGKNVYRTLFLSQPPVRNELFSPRRMAYVFEMDEEYSESDIPTILIRSKADCPVQEITTLTTNDIVINKLTQILSYLRQGMRTGKKSKKKEKVLPADIVPVSKLPEPKLPAADQSIFDDAGDYVFGRSSSSLPSNHPPKSYFDSMEGIKKPKVQDHPEPVGPQPADQLVKDIKHIAKTQPLTKSVSELGSSMEERRSENKGSFGILDMEGAHYAECYPGGLEEFDGNYDSDEDADFTKMDMGSKKGPVKRWDFDNEEDYSQYQSKREALPKAAFQYGVKMSEGRKTRRFGGGAISGKAREKAKLDREWQQISAILDKRKGGGSRESASSAKRSKLQ